MGVMRLGYVHIKVTDLGQAREHYGNTLGMSVAAENAGKAVPQGMGRVRPPLGRP